jgi:hypothetical protein
MHLASTEHAALRMVIAALVGFLGFPTSVPAMIELPTLSALKTELNFVHEDTTRHVAKAPMIDARPYFLTLMNPRPFQCP